MALVLMVLSLVLMILACVLMVLALVMKVLTALALVLMTVAQSYLIFTDGFWGYLQSKKNHWLTHSLTHSVNNIGLRDASASKNNEQMVVFYPALGLKLAEVLKSLSLEDPPLVLEFWGFQCFRLWVNNWKKVKRGLENGGLLVQIEVVHLSNISRISLVRRIWWWINIAWVVH